MVCSEPQQSRMSEVRDLEYFERLEESGKELTEERLGGEAVIQHDGTADKEAVRVREELQELSDELNKMLDLKVCKYVSNTNLLQVF